MRGFLEAATAALPPSQLSRALRAVGTRYLQPLPDTFKEDIKALLHTSTSPAAAVKASPPAPYMGIRNLACTCYINATVQQLVNIPVCSQRGQRQIFKLLRSQLLLL